MTKSARDQCINYPVRNCTGSLTYSKNRVIHRIALDSAFCILLRLNCTIMCDTNMTRTLKENLNYLIEREFTPYELKKITGLSRRQIAEWDKKGILLSKERKSSDTWSWRKFTGANVIQLAILSELRNAGLSPVDLRELAFWLKDEEKKMMKKIKEQITKGNSVFLNTNLQDRFIIISSEEKIEDAFGLILGHKNFGKDKVVFQINISNIINDLVRTIK